jgi:hypothetical protein
MVFAPAKAGFGFAALHFTRFVAEFIPQSGAPQLLLLHPRQIRISRGQLYLDKLLLR